MKATENTSQSPPQTLRLTVDRWLEFAEGNYAETTFKNYKRCINRFSNFFSFDCGNRLEQITTERIERFLLSLDMKKSSKNSFVITLKSFFRKMNEWYGLPNIAKSIKKFRVSAYKRRFITEEEYRKILVTCEPIEKAVVEFFANTGLRNSEFLSLTQLNIKGDILRFVGKGTKERVVPLNETARLSIDYIFSLSSHETSAIADCLLLNRTSLTMAMYRLAGRCKVPSFSPHALRRFFANRMRKHVDLYIVSKLLGHASLQTTQAYLACQPDELKGVTDVLIGGRG